MEIFETLRWDHIRIRDCIDQLIETSTAETSEEIGMIGQKPSMI